MGKGGEGGRGSMPMIPVKLSKEALPLPIILIPRMDLLLTARPPYGRGQSPMISFQTAQQIDTFWTVSLQLLSMESHNKRRHSQPSSGKTS